MNQEENLTSEEKAIQSEPTEEQPEVQADPSQEGQENEVLSDGLTSAEVERRKAEGKVNGKMEVRTKTYGQIFKSNFLTLFNLLNLVLVILVVTLGKSIKNASFVLPAVINVIIGLVQEIKAKRTIDKLSLISAPKVTVLRDGKETEITVPEIVLDDVMILSAGNQICSDCVIAESGCEVDESLITGESDPVVKNVGDELLSGSYVVSGKVKAKVVRVGMDNYAAKISSGAKYIKATNSDILLSLRAVIKVMSIIVVPLGIILFLKTYFGSSVPLDQSIVKMVSSMVSMIPQGLIALTSTVFAISVIRLAKHKTLSQDLYCIETLARVDVLCLDKTGTITEGDMQVNSIVPKNDVEEERIDEALKALVTFLTDSNPTFNAIKDKYKDSPEVNLELELLVPFSSARKWSGISLKDGRSFVMGAPEFVLKEDVKEYTEEMNGYAKEGERVLVLVQVDGTLKDELPKEKQVMAFILIGDKIRKEAPDTLKFFRDQDVDIRIISGDNPVTVSAIAKKAGLDKCEYIDMSTVKTDEELIDASRVYKVFGRVTPDQKLKLVKALKADGHTVAMTGDGVNDVLALKEADCSIAMASGSDAARNAAQLVLLDNNFASMPRIVAEGRRSINNLQRSASLYLVKTIYSALLTMLFIFIPYAYPFDATNITLVGAVTIGIPSFILALEPNKDRVKGRFLPNALSKSLPAALNIVVSVAFLQIVRMFLINALKFDLTEDQITTVSVVLLTFGAFIELFVVCMPFDVKRASLFVAMVGLFILGWLLSSMDLVVFGKPLNVFSMTSIIKITKEMWITMGISLGMSIPLFLLINYLMSKYATKSSEKIIKTLKLD